jgi:hypothetical protein
MTTSVYGDWFQMDFGSNKQIAEYRFANWGADKEIGSWTLAGSTDLSSWVEVDTRIEVITGHMGSYVNSTFTPNGSGASNSYRYFRFIVRGLLSQPYEGGTTTEFIMTIKDSNNEFLQSSSSIGSQNFGNGAITVLLGTSYSIQPYTIINALGAGPLGAGYYYATNNTYTGSVYTAVSGIAPPPPPPTTAAALSGLYIQANFTSARVLSSYQILGPQGYNVAKNFAIYGTNTSDNNVFLIDEQSNWSDTNISTLNATAYSRYYIVINSFNYSDSLNVIWIRFYDQNNNVITPNSASLSTDWGAMTISTGGAASGAINFFTNSDLSFHYSVNGYQKYHHPNGNYIGSFNNNLIVSLIDPPSNDFTNVYGEYVDFTLSSPSSIKSYGLGTYDYSMSILEWYVLGSTNNISWDIIDHQTTPNTTTYNTVTYTLTSPTMSYNYVRIVFKALANSNLNYYTFFSAGFWLKNETNQFITSTERSYASSKFNNYGSYYDSLRTNEYTGAVGPNINTNSGSEITSIVRALYSGPGYSYTGDALSRINPPPTAPTESPTSLSWVDNYNGSILVSFTSGSNGGSPITNYAYSLNGGSSFTELNPAQASSPIIISGLTNRTNYSVIIRSINAFGTSPSSASLSLRYLCFLEGTQILCFNPVTQQEENRAIETLRKGDLVKTFSNGYKPIDTIGTSKIYNPANSMRSLDRLYRCPKENYPSLTEDLVITGCHSILVKNITKEESEALIYIQNRIYVTEKHYRLIAAADNKAVPYEQEGVFNIWHLALEHPQYTFNYGVYANGLLVESSSMRMMREMSGMNLIE